MLAQPMAMLKRFVYVLRNQESPPRYYTGLTSDVVRRQAEHNAGTWFHTAKYRPWTVDVVIEFRTSTALRLPRVNSLNVPVIT